MWSPQKPGKEVAPKPGHAEGVVNAWAGRSLTAWDDLLALGISVSYLHTHFLLLLSGEIKSSYIIVGARIQ